MIGGLWGAPSPRAIAEAARSIVRQELADGPGIELGSWNPVEALDAAEELVRHPRTAWPRPTDSWERLVVALAVMTLRLRGSVNVPRAVARQALLQALGRASPGPTSTDGRQGA